jgi:Na+-translocating ferredoxin:NAD+ oxidoreductase RnfG subunit
MTYMKQFSLVVALLFVATAASAHVTPPRILMTDAEAVRALLPEGENVTRADIKLTNEQKQEIKKTLGWTPDQKNYKVFVGRNAQGRYVGRVAFMGDITIHGLVQMAVALDAAGNVKGAAVVAITDEAYGWVKPLVDQNFAAQFVGKKPTDAYVATQQVAARRGSMETFYLQVLATLLQRSSVICHTAGTPA